MATAAGTPVDEVSGAACIVNRGIVVRELVLLGAGGNAHDVMDIVEAGAGADDPWRVQGNLDDGKPRGHVHAGLRVLGGLDAAAGLDGAWFISTIRNERVFRHAAQIIEGLGVPGERFATLVHPGASVSSRATVAPGVYVCFGASVAGGARLASHVSVGPGATIGHDTAVGPHSILAAGAIIGGGVGIGSSCYIGSGALVKQNLAVGDRALIGMGAVVVSPVEPDTVVVGNPAQPLAKGRQIAATERKAQE